MTRSSRRGKVLATLAVAALLCSSVPAYYALRPPSGTRGDGGERGLSNATAPSIPTKAPTAPAGGGVPDNTTILPQPKRDWTVLFYVAYDNSIGPMEAWASDQRLLSRSGDSDEVNLVALVDEEHDCDSRIVVIDGNRTRPYPVSVVNPGWGGEVDTGDPQVLSDFLRWGVRMFPASCINLHFLDHGGAWMGLCIDESQGGMLDAWEVRSVLLGLRNATGRNIDLVSFDACYMADLEFGYEICDCADHLCGLETFATGMEDPENASCTMGNWRYDIIYRGLKAHPEWAPEDLALQQLSCMNPIGPYIVPSVGTVFLQCTDAFGAADLGFLTDFVRAFDRLSREMLSSVTGPGGDEARRQFRLEVVGHPESPPDMNTESFHGQCALTGNNPFRLYDIGDLLGRLVERGGLLCDAENAREVRRLYNDVIVGCVHGENAAIGEHPDATGLELFIPSDDGKYLDQYAATRFARDTAWDEFLGAVQRKPQ